MSVESTCRLNSSAALPRRGFGAYFTSILHAPFATLALLAVAVLSHGSASALTVADFTADYLAGTSAGQTRAALSADGWDYKTNTNGNIGTAAGYVSLTWNTSFAAYADGTTTNSKTSSGAGRPGQGVSQNGVADRFTLAAYTIQPGEAGPIYLTNSSLSVPASGNVELRIYVNDTQNGNPTFRSGGGAVTTFDRFLGVLAVGDTVYVAVGPNSTNTNDSYNLQFRLDRLAAQPVFAPLAGTVATPTVQVTMTSATPDAVIYYTVDSSAPTTASLQYFGPVTVNVTANVNAIAVSPTLGSSLPTAALYVNNSPPSNDNFANAMAIGGSLPFVKVDDNIAATAEVGEPHHAGVSAIKSVWYSWTPNISTGVSISTVGSALDTTLAVYTGTTLTGLSLVASSADIVTPTNTASQVNFVTVAGTKYYIAVDGSDGAEGTFTLAFSQAVQVGIASFAPTANETGAVPGSFTITRTGNTTAPLTVGFSISGTANPSVDYLRLDDTATIAAGSTIATVTVTPIDNNRYNPNATVILTLNPPGGASIDPSTGLITASTPYTVDPAHPSATVTIIDNDAVTTDKAEAVAFTPPHGFYDAAFQLSLTSPTPGAQIRYTLDGTVPTATSTLYSTPLTISQTTVMRAVSFKSGLDPSKCVTSTYVFVNDVVNQSPTGQPPAGWPSSWGQQDMLDGTGIIRPNKVDYGMDPNIVNSASYSSTIRNDLKSLPVISIVMKLDDLFNPSTNPYVGGIYANSFQEDVTWEKPCSIELFDASGAQAGFQANCGVRSRGGASSIGLNPKHSFRFYFRDEYGAKELNYPLFGPDPAAKTFQQFDLAAFSQDSWSSFQYWNRACFIRDVFAHDTHLAMGRVTPRDNYYHVYINGQYWGMWYSEEHAEGNFAAGYFGGNASDYDVIKAKYTVSYATAGSIDAWENLWKQCKAGLASNAAYYKIQGRNPDGSLNPAYENLLEIDDLIDFMLVHYYTGNQDGPISSVLGNPPVIGCNNFIGARNRNGSAGFRFFIHDSEFTFVNVNDNRLGPFGTGDNIVNANPQWMFQQCHANAEFNLRVADFLQRRFFNGGTLTPASCISRFMARKNQIDRAVVGESARWGDQHGTPAYTRDGTWITEVNNLLNNFFPQRSGIVLNQFISLGYFPSLSAPTFSQYGGAISAPFSLSVNNPNASGRIYYTLDGTDPRKIGGTIQGIDGGTTTIGVPLNGTTTVRARVLNGTIWSAIQEATFTTTQDFTKLKVTEIMYNPPAMGVLAGDQLEFIELKNTGTAALNLSDANFTQGITYTFPQGSVLNAGQFIVLCSNAAAFGSKYPGVTPFGAFSGHLSNSGETITLASSTGVTILSFTYNDAPPWPATPDGSGFSLVPVDSANPGDPNNSLTWRPSANMGGSPGADDPAPPATARVLINEALTHSNLPLVDYIELINTDTTTASIGGWYLSDDRNDPKKFKIPAGTALAPGQFAVFDETQFNATPGAGTSFSLSSLGELVYLFAADANGNLTGYSHGFSFGASAPDVSFGRYTISTGADHFVAQIARTSGQTNSGPRVGPVVITEIMYHPLAGGDDFVELLNISTSPVQLFDPAIPANTWKLNGLSFTFPQNVVIPSGGLILVTAIDPVTFRQKYNVPAAAQIFGPYAGTLQADGETLELQRPDVPEASQNFVVPYIVVDAVKFSNKLPWPIEPDGNGPSLSRINPYAYGNDPINWHPSIANGGSPGTAEPTLASAPSNASAVTISSSQINLAWTDNSNNENGFRVERSLDGVNNWLQVAEVGANVTTYQDIGLEGSTRYYYRIFAFNIAGVSAYTAVVDAKTLEAPPKAPTNLTVASASANRIDLTWTDASTNEKGFKIERSPDGAGGWTQVGSSDVNVAAFQDYSVAALTTYYYRVFAFNDIAPSLSSNIVSATTPQAPPGVPQFLTPTAQSASVVRLDWVDGSNNEKGFKIERSPDGTTNWQQVGSTAANVTTFLDSTVAADTTYYYRIFAFHDTAVSPYSNVAPVTTSHVPKTPQNFAATAIAATKVSLTWTDAADNETGFSIERSPDGTTNWTLTGSATANATKFTDSTASADTTFYYRITAFNSADVSPPSTVASATTSHVPATPQTVVATALSYALIQVTWNDVADNETGFTIERSLDGISNWTQAGSTGANITTFPDTTVAEGTTYFYRVSAVTAGDVSSPSNVAFARTPHTTPISPSNLAVSGATSNRVDLSWTDASFNELGFKVERSANGIDGWSLVGSTDANVSIFMDTTVQGETAYFYRVFAYNDDAVSQFSNVIPATTAPLPPANLTITGAVYNRVDLAWTDTSSAENGFHVERSLDGTSGWNIAGTVTPNTTTFQDSTAAPRTLYYYRVNAFNDFGTSVSSNVVSVTTPHAQPAAPTTLSATALSDSQITLAWLDKSDDELGFRLERSLNGTDGWTQVAELAPDAVTKVDGGLAQVTFYYYRIHAYNATGDSALSNVAFAITFSTPPPDSDGDGIPDADEIAMGTNPHDPNSKPGGTADFDHDGIPDYLDADADGDGVSNADEVLAGTDPYDATSFPTTAMQVTKMQCKASFKVTGKDTCTLSGFIPGVPAKIDPTGNSVILDVAGAPASFVLDAKGKAKAATGTAALTFKPTVKNAITGKPEFAGGPVGYSIKLKGTFASSWQDEGFSATPSKTKTVITMKVTLRFAGKVYVMPVAGTLSNNSFVRAK